MKIDRRIRFQREFMGIFFGLLSLPIFIPYVKDDKFPVNHFTKLFIIVFLIRGIMEIVMRYRRKREKEEERNRVLKKITKQL